MRIPCLSVLLITLFQPLSADAQSSNGTIQLYDDGDCTLPRDAFSRQINSCLETNQAAGIAALSFPSCGNFPVILYVSDHEKCQRASFSTPPTSGNVGECLSLVTGAGIGSAAFVCVASVTTISASPTSQDSSIPSSQPPSSISQTTSSSTPSASPDPQDHGSTGKKLSRSDRITIAVGVSIGLAALIVAIVQLTPQRIRWPHGDDEVGPAPPPYREFELYHHRLSRFGGLFGGLPGFRTRPRR